MKILVACEESQIVTQAFRDKGHEAYSCDIIPTSGSHPEWHFQQDVTELLKQNWDMIIAFPPCTHLCNNNSKYHKEKIIDGRRNEGISFFNKFTNLEHVKKICIENPVGIMSTFYRTPDQVIRPYFFGHAASKRTCLWLKNLPLLLPTSYIQPKKILIGTKLYDKWWAETMKAPTKDRAKIRSKTFPGIALAMADQWG